ncbi:MAG: hypothetical protein KAT58_08110 [candidate division Zixibacteria bacterium]|nr:hypothetical protein [candidate division Zixibacteria bacterium]
MKTARIILLLVCMTLQPLAFSAAVTLTDEQAVEVETVRAALDIFFYGSADTQALTDSAVSLFDGKCGTPLALRAMYLHHRYGTALGFSDFFQRPFDALLPETFDSPSGHFKIHYTLQPGVDQIDLSYGDANANDVPDYAEIVARIADSVWVHHIDVLGYHEPPSDTIFSKGGDYRYDVYVKSLGTNYYGATYLDTFYAAEGTYRAPSYIVLHNHYEILPGYANRPIDALQVTMAHEFFHAIQFWYDAIEMEDAVQQRPNGSWLEMTAVWMEEQTYDNINDYYYYLGWYMPYVHLPLNFWTNSQTAPTHEQMHPYGAAIFCIYLSQVFGRDIIRDIWERCAELPGANAFYGAIDSAIIEMTGGERGFPDVLTEYYRWLLFTGDRQPSFFEEGANYPMIPNDDSIGIDVIYPYIRYVDQFPVQGEKEYRFYPSSLGGNYVVFNAAVLDTLIFNGVTSSPVGPEWRISVMGYNHIDPSVPVWVDDSLYCNRDTLIPQGGENLTQLIVVPVVTNPFYDKDRNNYRLKAYGDTTLQYKVNRVYPPRPSKLILGATPDNVIKIVVEMVEDAFVYLDVYTVAGEWLFTDVKPGSRGFECMVSWDGTTDRGQQVASGIYVLVVKVSDQTETFKVLVVR